METIFIVTGTSYYDAAGSTNILKVFASKDDAEEYRRSLRCDHYPYNEPEYHSVDIEEHEIVRKDD